MYHHHGPTSIDRWYRDTACLRASEPKGATCQPERVVLPWRQCLVGRLRGARRLGRVRYRGQRPKAKYGPRAIAAHRCDKPQAKVAMHTPAHACQNREGQHAKSNNGMHTTALGLHGLLACWLQAAGLLGGALNSGGSRLPAETGPPTRAHPFAHLPRISFSTHYSLSLSLPSARPLSPPLPSTLLPLCSPTSSLSPLPRFSRPRRSPSPSPRQPSGVRRHRQQPNNAF